MNRVEFTYDVLGRRLSKLAGEYSHWVWNGHVPLHEWNSGREWKNDGWQHYELDLRTCLSANTYRVRHSWNYRHSKGTYNP